MNNDQLAHYQNKLKYEMDSADLFEALGNKENIIVMDTRKVRAYEEEHIPNAISFPHREMNKGTLSKLDTSVLYISYCDGIGCNGSTKGALKLTENGFRVKELLGGLDWWKRDDYATEGKMGKLGTEITCNC